VKTQFNLQVAKLVASEMLEWEQSKEEEQLGRILIKFFARNTL
jgi:hypothetical protein